MSARDTVEMNMGINGLYQIVRTEMELPPLGRAVFIFFSKTRQQVKLLQMGWRWFLAVPGSNWSEEPLNCHSLTPRTNNAKCRTRTLSAIMSGICLKSMKYEKETLIYSFAMLYLTYCISVR